MKSNNLYKTKDLSEASMLLVKGISLIEINKVNGVCWFIFNDEQKCKELSSRFFFEDIEVNAREYYEAMKRLKNRIFNTHL